MKRELTRREAEREKETRVQAAWRLADGWCDKESDQRERADRAESEAAALRAEVERLRAENIELESFRSVFGRDDAKKLAAANALLRRVPRWTVPADTVKPDRFQQAGLDLTRDIDAHLSGQAPERKK